MLNFKQTLQTSSIRTQLFSWLLTLLLPFMLISGATAYWVTNQYINKSYDKTLYRTALALAEQVELNESGFYIDLPETAKKLLEFDENDDIYFRIIGPNGDLISTHTDLPIPKVYPNEDQFLFYDAIINQDRLRTIVYALPAIKAPNTDKTRLVYVMVGETMNKRTMVTSEVMLSILLPQILITIMVSVLIFYGIKRGLRPLDELSVELIQRHINDLSPVNDTKKPDELQPLLAVLNNLLARLNSAIAKQQRFISDAAHQLKTPLAGLKMQAELAMREKDTQKNIHALSQINQASENLSHLVNQLLSLSKSEPDGSLSLSFESVDLVKLAKAVCADWVTMALNKNIDLGFDSTIESASIQGNIALLREMLNNLIDNAIRYSPHSGKITVSLKRESAIIRLAVQDNGMGIASEDKARVFERFYRVLGTMQEGSGLGLSIVKEIADRHQATVSLISDGLNAGTTFTISFNQSFQKY